jgi:toxin ParE1/3/4
VIVEWSAQARLDRNSQLLHIAEHNPQAAIDQGELIRRQITILVDHPDIGRPGRRRGTRELVVSRSPFVIIYRINSARKQIEILRLLHGAQRWPPKR